MSLTRWEIKLPCGRQISFITQIDNNTTCQQLRNNVRFVDSVSTLNTNFIFSYDVPAGCLNTETGGIEDGKILRVVETGGQEISVTVSNQDGDGYLPIPDNEAGEIGDFKIQYLR